MLQSRRHEVRSTVRWEQLKIKAKELGLYHDSLTDTGIALGATLIAELSFTAVREIGEWEAYAGDDPSSDHGSEGASDHGAEVSGMAATGSRGATRAVHAIFVVVSICAACCGVQCVVVCASTVVFGPGLALRGQRGEPDMAAAIQGMREERDTAFRWLLRALYCLELSVLPLSWLKLKSVPAACVSCGIVAALLWATRSFAVRRVLQTFSTTDEDKRVQTPPGSMASRSPSQLRGATTLRHRTTSQSAEQHGPQ